MKKLPFCALSAGALFVILGTSALLYFAPRPEPFPMLFPLLWDLAMVSIGLGVIFRCEVARKAGFVWSVFCIIASLVVGVATFLWIRLQHPEALGQERIMFMVVTVGFGVVFGIWQLLVLRHPTALPWTSPTEIDDHKPHAAAGRH
jgi:hypothetical protein